jgi:hypothetical protein
MSYDANNLANLWFSDRNTNKNELHPILINTDVMYAVYPSIQSVLK